MRCTVYKTLDSLWNGLLKRDKTKLLESLLRISFPKVFLDRSLFDCLSDVNDAGQMCLSAVIYSDYGDVCAFGMVNLNSKFPLITNVCRDKSGLNKRLTKGCGKWILYVLEKEALIHNKNVVYVKLKSEGLKKYYQSLGYNVPAWTTNSLMKKYLK